MARTPNETFWIRNKFRGCMLGILLGDCLGKPFVWSDVRVAEVQEYFDILDYPFQNMTKKIYTSNTALTKCVARCLIDKPHLDTGYLISQLEDEYWKNHTRGYTAGLVRVLLELWDGNFDLLYDPARSFCSYVVDGNASVISVAPIALLSKNDYMEMYTDAIRITALTDAHRITVRGALLYCVAIRQCLRLSPQEMVAHTTYIDMLLEKLKYIEALQIPEINDPTPFQTQLQKISAILTDELTYGNYQRIGSNEFLCGIGTTALHAVPSAIYCYLRAQRPIVEIKACHLFTRSIQLAISCGGDTNCIAALVGCLAGAHYGEANISEQLRSHCESVSDMIEIADALVELYMR